MKFLFLLFVFDLCFLSQSTQPKLIILGHRSQSKINTQKKIIEAHIISIHTKIDALNRYIYMKNDSVNYWRWFLLAYNIKGMDDLFFFLFRYLQKEDESYCYKLIMKEFIEHLHSKYLDVLINLYNKDFFDQYGDFTSINKNLIFLYFFLNEVKINELKFFEPIVIKNMKEFEIRAITFEIANIYFNLNSNVKNFCNSFEVKETLLYKCVENAMDNSKLHFEDLFQPILIEQVFLGTMITEKNSCSGPLFIYIDFQIELYLYEIFIEAISNNETIEVKNFEKIWMLLNENKSKIQYSNNICNRFCKKHLITLFFKSENNKYTQNLVIQGFKLFAKKHLLLFTKYKALSYMINNSLRNFFDKIIITTDDSYKQNFMNFKSNDIFKEFYDKLDVDGIDDL